jgi:hypothetical protein
VPRRVLLGVVAWLLGAVVATGGSLFAVSALGQIMSPAAGDQLSMAAVNQALASEAAEQPAGLHPLGARRLPRAQRTQASRPHRQPPPPGPADGTVLTSAGGTVIAGCAGRRVYLISWSPQQGFQASGATPRPAATARVTFTGPQQTVTVVASCRRGVPVAASSVTPILTSPPGGDDG